MKIFVIKSSERDYICADTNIEALQVYLSHTGLDIDELDGTEDIKELSETQWEEYKILDVDSYDEDGNHPIKETFKEYMKKAFEAEVFCSTCY